MVVIIYFLRMLRNENSIKSETKPNRFLKPVRFGSKVLEVIKSSLLSIIRNPIFGKNRISKYLF